MDFNSIIDKFQAAMLENGIAPPANIITDGKIHRFYITGDKQGTKNGWYAVFMDRLPAGVFGNWKSSVTLKWCNKNPRHMSQSEYAEFKKQIIEAKNQRNTELIKEQSKAAIKAEQLYNRCTIANINHQYLLRKQIAAFCARQSGKSLVLPIVDIHKKIWSLQYIKEYSSKMFMKNGKIKGNFIIIQGDLNYKYILICEGFATGCSLALADPNVCVIAACNATNLTSVATNIRHISPNAIITIWADDDRLTPGNPGITEARKAAITVGALYVKPMWPEGSPNNLTDFNDLACWLIENGTQKIFNGLVINLRNGVHHGTYTK